MIADCGYTFAEVVETLWVLIVAGAIGGAMVGYGIGAIMGSRK